MDPDTFEKMRVAVPEVQEREGTLRRTVKRGEPTVYMGKEIAAARLALHTAQAEAPPKATEVSRLTAEVAKLTDQATQQCLHDQQALEKKGRKAQSFNVGVR
jgi:HAMP domain-containing protein